MKRAFNPFFSLLSINPCILVLDNFLIFFTQGGSDDESPHLTHHQRDSPATTMSKPGACSGPRQRIGGEIMSAGMRAQNADL